MTKQNRDSKYYFLEAKKRLLNDDYYQYKNEAEESYFINNKKISKDQIEELKNTIECIMASDEFVYNPLSRIILDEIEFNNLSELSKEKYMFELSKLYVHLKNKIS